jgi:hypothetical protein
MIDLSPLVQPRALRVRGRLTAYLLASSLLLLGPGLSKAHAQMDAGSLRVLVLDQSAAVIPGATVTLTNTSTGTAQSAASDGQGYVNFTPLPRGTYDLLTALDGFRSRQLQGVTVDVNERKFLRVILDTAQVSEAVEVSASRRTLQTEEGSLGQVIQGKVAVELPLAGRRYTELALLVPGATPSTMTLDTRGPGWFIVNGNAQTQNNFMLDGFDNNQGTQNAQSLSSQVVQPNPDAIEQFKVQTNSFSAEFGRSAGAVVNVSIKSGTNAIHGSSWYYNRDAALAAKSWNANTNGLAKDDLKWHQGGATFGGPILKNKLFYFGSYEGFHREFSSSGVGSVPTEAERHGVFSVNITDPRTGQPFPNRTVPKDRWDPLAAKILGVYDMPNRPGRVTTSGLVADNYAYQAPAYENTHKVDLRSDLVADANNRFFVRYSLLQQRIWRDQILSGIAEANSSQGEQYNRNHNLGVSYNRVIGSRIVNELRVGYTNTDSRFAHATADGMKADEFGFKGLPPEQLSTGGIPLINLPNYTSVGVRNFRPQFQKPKTYQFLDTVSMLLGQHSLRAGFEARMKRNLARDTERVVPSYTFSGNFTGNSLADFLLGYANSLSASTVPAVDWRQEAYSGFLQDDYKVTQKLTVNAGVRYEYTTPYYGAGQYKNINFDPSTGQLVNATDSDEYLVDPDRNNVAPRLGVAYQALPDRLVLRGGYGLFYSLEDMNGSEGMIAFNPPTTINATLQSTGTGPSATPAVILSDPFPASMLANYNSNTVTVKGRNRDQQAATIQQWNIAAEMQLPWQSSLEVAYVGNRGANLQANMPINVTQYGINGAIPANRPYPQWQQVSMWFSAGKSTYDSLQLKFEKRQSRGLYMLTSYTLANAQEEVGAWGAGGHGIQDTLLPDFSNLAALLRADRGPNAQTAHHRLTFTEVWQLPIGRGRAIGSNMGGLMDAVVGGWQLSSITSWRTGMPVNVSLTRTGTDPATGLAYSFFDRNGGSLRPNLTGVDPNGNSDAGADRLHYLDPAAYSVPAVNTPGNATPGSAWGPGALTTDISLVKRFTFNFMTADVRAEAFNLLNHTNWGMPNASYPSATFGSITTAGDPRVVQLAVRIGF